MQNINGRICVAFASKIVYPAYEVNDMAKTANINIRIEPEVKSSVDGIYSRFGLTVADAVKIFLHKSIMVGGLPFDLTLPRYNDETLVAMQEARDIASGKIKAKSYASVKEMVAELDSEESEN
ncbi:MAG: type II toxin-antitoxin system RelB/DinJ family antitoxin [Defluviitaleaceae bacterium]|nr:type II toxin-antitoxin system RelB/DinJ family antitoxin [Defluviitaleaceae bacterium]MCL2240414.1 type II toxin-antitoxin system RelB/DinJ family antitoxin [Defluviitaleaceae bacterium]